MKQVCSGEQANFFALHTEFTLCRTSILFLSCTPQNVFDELHFIQILSASYNSAKSIHRLMDDFEEQIEEKYLHEIQHFENVLHSTLSPQQGFLFDAP